MGGLQSEQQAGLLSRSDDMLGRLTRKGKYFTNKYRIKDVFPFFKKTATISFISIQWLKNQNENFTITGEVFNIGFINFIYFFERKRESTSGEKREKQAPC